MIVPSPETLANELWAGTGLHDTFPRRIEQAIAFKLPLALVRLAPLTVATVGHWLQQRGISTRLPDHRRDLCGCLVAFAGRGFIFVCDTDSPEEQRLTMAHETAHFLSDYLWPRQQVLHELGEGVAGALDGLRPATPAERAAAILSRVRLGPHIHVLPRRGRDEDSDVAVVHAEDRADRLALELVAPQARVRDVLKGLLARQMVTPDDLCAALARKAIYAAPTGSARRNFIARLPRRFSPASIGPLARCRRRSSTPTPISCTRRH